MTQQEGSMNTTIPDLMIVNDCTIIIPNSNAEEYRLLGTDAGEITFRIFDRVLIINSILYTEISILDQMLEALSHFAFLTHAKGICCDTAILLCTIAYLDSHGILDRDYTVKE